MANNSSHDRHRSSSALDPPRSAEELLHQYAAGERFFLDAEIPEGSSLRDAVLVVVFVDENRYFRLAGATSLLGFMASFYPGFFRRLIDRFHPEDQSPGGVGMDGEGRKVRSTSPAGP